MKNVISFGVTYNSVVFFPAAFGSTDNNLLTVIPFAFIKTEVVAKVRICGKGPFTVLLDTGTAPSIIDLGLARSLGIKTGEMGHSASGGGNGKAEFYVATLPTLEMNGCKMSNVSSLAMDLSGLSKKFGRRLDAVLGDSVFDGHVVQFDYPSRIARFYRTAPKVSGSKLEFKHSDSEVHLVGCRINGVPVIANIDTGSNSGFQLTPRGIGKLHLEEVAAHSKSSQASGFNGSYQNHVGRISTVTLGSIRRTNFEATFWLSGTGHDDCKFDVNIGNAFLRDFVLTIDYMKQVVWLNNPNSEPKIEMSQRETAATTTTVRTPSPSRINPAVLDFFK